ncbi:MAG: FG-GAP-like repeat-containing protein, partial [Bacteroidota bacterium]
DLLVNNVNQPAFVYRNDAQLQGNHFLKIAFKGQKGNPLGVGAMVTVFAGEKKLAFQHYPSRGFQSSVAPGLVIGLGKSETIDSLRVIWPDLQQEVLLNVAADQELTLMYANVRGKRDLRPKGTPPMFEDIAQQTFAKVPVHTENRFNDFDQERLLPHMLSTQGARLLTGDLNGDQREDFMLLGAENDPDQLFFQNAAGGFDPQQQSIFEEDKAFESTCGTFFDADGDGDLDVMLGAGGNDARKKIDSYILRYYENDGKGNLIKQIDKTPLAGGQLSCIRAADMDGDGDQDLFLSGRSVPGNYGLIPNSFLFRNDNGKWTNVTPPYLGGIGMITDAVWADQNQDGTLDLVVVGEWLPVLIYLNQGGKLQAPQAVKGSEGWWTRIKAADLDQDGKTDFILGNWGLNSKFSASESQPLEMYVKDFDGNGKTEFILNWYPPLDEQAYPFAGKMDITSQMPHLKKRVLKYEDYAQTTYQTLFTEAEREGARRVKATQLASCVLWNGAQMRLQELPWQAQLAPVFGIEVLDVNGDGQQDLLLGGNFYGLKPEAGYHDASRGAILLGDNNRAWKSLSPSQSGFLLDGEVRDIHKINGNGQVHLLVSRSNGPIGLYRGNN